ncbi:50S ribosomal protein L4 [Carboxylicivirga sediminis]|uniref:Large ribosomal subunit protein uL4 n=1 Tax=Carboxylicivirga sediminis TaxID=2006564 RepID=A0A941F688_9BACT|nr:50S ribosomal protein L4 [Carboxylicivirga sediminis]MBR8536455.1 50S ribosomal protein L4 [Carboxylicivirga sediminis]
MELNVLTLEGKETGRKVTLPEAVFGIEPSDHAIYLDVKQYLANNRQGTHKSKERAEIAGSTRKIKKQKGTGTARAGSIKSPVFVGGGRVFGPRPRNYRFKLNKKLKQLARKSALAYKAQQHMITVLEDFNFEAPKTKEYAAMIANLKMNGQRSLLVLKEANDNIYRSARNIQRADVVTLAELNTYDIMKAKNLVLVESSVEEFGKLFNA